MYITVLVVKWSKMENKESNSCCPELDKCCVFKNYILYLICIICSFFNVASPGH